MKKITLITLLFLMMNNGFAQSTNYKMVVKFGSMCCGVPSSKPLQDYILAFKNKNKVKKISCDSIGPMGREGEYYLAFHLTELSKHQALIFVNEILDLAPNMKEKGYANVEENMEIDKATLGRAAIVKKNF